MLVNLFFSIGFSLLNYNEMLKKVKRRQFICLLVINDQDLHMFPGIPQIREQIPEVRGTVPGISKAFAFVPVLFPPPIYFLATKARSHEAGDLFYVKTAAFYGSDTIASDKMALLCV
jgi:hypothetical protein